MGHGIAQVAAMDSTRKNHVVALEANQVALQAGRRKIEESLSKIFSKKVQRGSISAEDAELRKEEILSRISFTSEMGALSNCDIVIEAITENPEVKLSFYKDLGRITQPHCILASNTSSFSIKVRSNHPWKLSWSSGTRNAFLAFIASLSREIRETWRDSTKYYYNST